MKVQTVRSVLLLMVFSFAVTGALADIPIATNVNTVAFYAMTDNEVGTKFLNPNRESADYKGTAYSTNFSVATAFASSFARDSRMIGGRVYGDGYIEITDQVPGKYLFSDAAARIPMCDSYHSAHLVKYKGIAGNAQPMMFLNGFGSETTKNRTQWTFEWFVRNVDTTAKVMAYFDMNASGKHVQLEFPTAGKSGVRLSYANEDEGKTAADNNSTVTLSDDLTCDGKWHHVALVYYQEPDTTDGTMKLFVDYVEGSGTVHFYRDLATEVTSEFRFSNSVGDGYVSALRFSGTALSVNELMRASDSKTLDSASRIAFYPLDEQPVGNLLTTDNSSAYDSNATFYTNQVVSSFNSNGKTIKIQAKAVSGGGGVAFKSVADVPARYVYSSLAATVPLREPKTSLYMTDGTYVTKSSDSGLYNVMLDVSDLSKDLNAVSSWTFEWFVKYETEPTSTLMYAKLWDQMQIMLKKSGTHDSVTVESNYPKGSATVKYPDADYSLCDGKWHHIALVNEDGQLSLFCDYTLSAGPVEITQDASKTAAEVRFGQSSWRGMLSCFRVTAAALGPREFMYASDSATGVAGATAGWHWKLDGTKGSAASAIVADTDMTEDPDQYVFKDAHAFTGLVSGGGTAVYSNPLGLGHRLIDGVDCGKNESAVALSGASLRAGQTGLLCGLGLTYTAEAMVSAAAPVSGHATVMGVRTTADGLSWCLKLDDSGTLTMDVAMIDGSVVSRTVAEGFAATAHHVAVKADLLNRDVEVFVDYESRCALSADDFPMQLVYGDELVLGGGFDNSNMAGSVDEVRVSRAAVGVDGLIHFTGKPGLILVFR